MDKIFKAHEAHNDLKIIELTGLDYYGERFSFIWGNWPYGEANAFTPNEIDIVHDNVNNEYILTLDATYCFETKKEECKYLVKLLNLMYEWMKEEGFDTTYKLAPWDGIPLAAPSIAELFAQFKIYVNGYCAVYGDDESRS